MRKSFMCISKLHFTIPIFQMKIYRIFVFGVGCSPNLGSDAQD